MFNISQIIFQGTALLCEVCCGEGDVGFCSERLGKVGEEG